jgi:hypothetical protein
MMRYQTDEGQQTFLSDVFHMYLKFNSTCNAYCIVSAFLAMPSLRHCFAVGMHYEIQQCLFHHQPLGVPFWVQILGGLHKEAPNQSRRCRILSL